MLPCQYGFVQTDSKANLKYNLFCPQIDETRHMLTLNLLWGIGDLPDQLIHFIVDFHTTQFNYRSGGSGCASIKGNIIIYVCSSYYQSHNFHIDVYFDQHRTSQTAVFLKNLSGLHLWFKTAPNWQEEMFLLYPNLTTTTLHKCVPRVRGSWIFCQTKQAQM